MAKEYKSLEEYGLIGNLETCALIGRDGSIDWCCFPHLESPSVFAALLDSEKGGHFRISPLENADGYQSYSGNTNVLVTTFQTSTGSVSVTDFMPVRGHTDPRHQTLLRKVTCSGGRVELEIEFKPRFDYARVVPALETAGEGTVAQWQDHLLHLQSLVPLDLNGAVARGTFTVEEGEPLWFVLRYGASSAMEPADCQRLLQATTEYWSDWAHHCGPGRCVFRGPWHNHVVRSALVLKLLTHPQTGAIAAAPTTSLPEVIGGVRNWDYRFAWIRDASFTVQSLHALGHEEEALQYFQWLRSLCREFGSDDDHLHIRVMYGLHGEQDLEEHTLDHLSGYRNSAPVRVGNAAAEQIQLDVYGELVNAFYETRRYGEEITQGDWGFIHKIVNTACQTWDTEDSGIWEVRGGPRHFTYSKLMCWVALDRSIELAEKYGLEASLGEWKKTRQKIRQAILERGFSEKLGSFVQSFDSEALDATSLLIPVMGFLPPEDHRVQGTIAATLQHLTSDGMVYRYLGDDGLPGQEGTFVLCTFWLVDALVLAGELEKAEALLLGVLKHVSPLGLLAEQIDATSGEQLGNYPQAFSHIGLMNTALHLAGALAEQRAAKAPSKDS
jgi:GH15 family glucan-1,4-alpha-glucosidase